MSIVKTSVIMMTLVTPLVAMEATKERNTISFVAIKETNSASDIKAKIWPLKQDKTAYTSTLCLEKTSKMAINVTTGCLEGEYGVWKTGEPNTRQVGSFNPNGNGYVKAGVILEQDSFDTYNLNDLTFYIHCWQLNKSNYCSPWLTSRPMAEATYYHEDCKEAQNKVICAAMRCALTEDGKYFAAKHSCGATYIFRMPSFMENKE